MMLVCAKEEFRPSPAGSVRWLDRVADYPLAAEFWERTGGLPLPRDKWDEANEEMRFRYAGALVDGKLVAVSALLAFSEEACDVAAVFTDANFRHRGYGKAVVSFVTAEILRTGRIPTCTTRDGNAAMIRTAQSVGFRTTTEAEAARFHQATELHFKRTKDQIRARQKRWVCSQKEFRPAPVGPVVRWLEREADFAAAAALGRRTDSPFNRRDWDLDHEEYGYRYAGICAADRLIAMGARMPFSDRGGRLSYLATDPDHRRTGCGQAVLSFLVADLMVSGRLATGIVRDDNVAMVGLAQKAGFRLADAAEAERLEQAERLYLDPINARLRAADQS